MQTVLSILGALWDCAAVSALRGSVYGAADGEHRSEDRMGFCLLRGFRFHWSDLSLHASDRSVLQHGQEFKGEGDDYHCKKRMHQSGAGGGGFHAVRYPVRILFDQRKLLIPAFVIPAAVTMVHFLVQMFYGLNDRELDTCMKEVRERRVEKNSDFA